MAETEPTNFDMGAMPPSEDVPGYTGTTPMEAALPTHVAVTVDSTPQEPESKLEQPVQSAFVQAEPSAPSIVEPTPVADTALTPEAVSAFDTETLSTWPTLTPQRIDDCKQLNDGRPIYQYTQFGVVIVYKGLIGAEYKALTDRFRAEGELSTPERQDEQTAAAAVLWPRLPETWFETALAGHAQTLALLVRQQSAFSLTTTDGRVIGKSLKTEELTPQDRVPPAEPTDEDIQTLRVQAPGQQLFLATFPDGNQNLFTPLPRIEWTSINKRLELNPEMDAALEVARFCVKWPTVSNWDQELAGKVNALFDAIMTQSAFNLEPQVVEL